VDRVVANDLTFSVFDPAEILSGSSSASGNSIGFIVASSHQNLFQPVASNAVELRNVCDYLRVLRVIRIVIGQAIARDTLSLMFELALKALSRSVITAHDSLRQVECASLSVGRVVWHRSISSLLLSDSIAIRVEVQKKLQSASLTAAMRNSAYQRTVLYPQRARREIRRECSKAPHIELAEAFLDDSLPHVKDSWLPARLRRVANWLRPAETRTRLHLYLAQVTAS
jgi:hypothetical protein